MLSVTSHVPNIFKEKGYFFFTVSNDLLYYISVSFSFFSCRSDGLRQQAACQTVFRIQVFLMRHFTSLRSSGTKVDAITARLKMVSARQQLSLSEWMSTVSIPHIWWNFFEKKAYIRKHLMGISYKNRSSAAQYLVARHYLCHWLLIDYFRVHCVLPHRFCP